jgi:hypothetical protein
MLLLTKKAYDLFALAPHMLFTTFTHPKPSTVIKTSPQTDQTNTAHRAGPGLLPGGIVR